MFDEHTLIFVASKIEISYKVKKDERASCPLILFSCYYVTLLTLLLPALQGQRLSRLWAALLPGPP